MKIGYPCQNLSLDCTSARTFRLSSYSPERLIETVNANLNCLERILRYNLDHNILYFRITSDLIPFASHPINQFPWQEYFAPRFGKIGQFIKESNMRVTMHPDQFTLINSPSEEIFARSLAELEYHCQVLDLLNVDNAHKIQIHVGGAYGDKPTAINRFIERYSTLPIAIRNRLVLENDERLFNLSDCLQIHAATEIPLVFDIFHHRLNNQGEDMADAFLSFLHTWDNEYGLPMVDYATQDPTKKPGAHAANLDEADFQNFLSQTAGYDFDIMLELKNKETPALKALQLSS